MSSREVVISSIKAFVEKSTVIIVAHASLWSSKSHKKVWNPWDALAPYSLSLTLLLLLFFKDLHCCNPNSIGIFRLWGECLSAWSPNKMPLTTFFCAVAASMSCLFSLVRCLFIKTGESSPGRSSTSVLILFLFYFANTAFLLLWLFTILFSTLTACSCNTSRHCVGLQSAL